MPRPKREFLVRFFEKVNKTDTCWLWQGNSWTPNGYGVIDSKVAHKVLYEYLVAPVPDGMELDHLCKIRSCVNINHLEVVTHEENNKRSDSPTGINARKQECDYGHTLEGRNLYITPNGRRQCRECVNRRAREYQARKRNLVKEASNA